MTRGEFKKIDIREIAHTFSASARKFGAIPGAIAIHQITIHVLDRAGLVGLRQGFFSKNTPF